MEDNLVFTEDSRLRPECPRQSATILGSRFSRLMLAKPANHDENARARERRAHGTSAATVAFIMKATELLKKQHEDVDRLFNALNRAKPQDKARLFTELATKLVAHDAIEREIFYPACEKRMGLVDELAEGIVEHGVVEFCLHRADVARGTDNFEHCVSVLRELLEHHIEEEEEELFPKVERALGAGRLEELAEKMEAAFEEKLEDDFRKPLQTNLRRVLAGGVKASPRGDAKRRGIGRKVAAKSAPKKRAVRGGRAARH